MTDQTGSLASEAELDALRDFLAHTPEFDLLRVPLCDATEFAPAPNLDLELVRAAQRIARLLPTDDCTTVIELLRTGVRSAMDLAELSAPAFEQRYGKFFTDPVVTAEVHRRARVVRAHVHLRYMQIQENQSRLPLSLNPIRRRN